MKARAVASEHVLTPAVRFPRGRAGDALLALLASLLALAVAALKGFPTLTDLGGDNDSLLRLVEVRDLLAGQGWFDLHQYRMGVEGGFVMHWSRLVDAPIAAIVLVAEAVIGNRALSEAVASVLWPLLLYGLTVFVLIRTARRCGGESAVLPALVIGGAALYFLGLFQPATLDHHNIQLLLTAASVHFLIIARDRRPAALLSGTCAALTLAIGMETAPYVAVIGLLAAGLFAVHGQREAAVARGFGLGFAGVSALVFAATVPASAWGEAHCDAFSTVQFVIAALAGFGLAAIASGTAASRTFPRRILSLGLLGFLVAAVFLIAFPQCLASPYAALDPRLKHIWLDNISETKSLPSLLGSDLYTVIGRYVTPLLALWLMGRRLRKGDWRRQDSIVGAVLAMSFLVSAWQVRGSTFSIAFAIIPLAAWVGTWRERAQQNPSARASLKMVGAWLVAHNLSWIGIAATAAVLLDGDKPPEITASCEPQSAFAALAGQPSTTVLSIADMGAPILAYTGHRALAGLYHRNIEGNLVAFDAFTGSAEEAKRLMARHHVGLVALCRGSGETGLLTKEGPAGFLSQLTSGKVPGWLEPISGTHGEAVEIYRVKTPG